MAISSSWANGCYSCPVKAVLHRTDIPQNKTGRLGLWEGPCGDKERKEKGKEGEE